MGAYAIEHCFVVGADTHFLDAASGNIASAIFCYDARRAAFVMYLTVGTHSAIDWTYVEVDDRRYMVVANEIAASRLHMC